MYQTAVIDNASLVYLSHLHKTKPIFDSLKNLFSTIYFPLEVVREYAIGAVKEPHREWILERLNPEQGFYSHCSSYDSITLSMVTDFNGIDKGEAEAYAQLRKVNANFIISDDKQFISALNKLDRNIKIYTILHLICWLDQLKLILDWNSLIKDLYIVRKIKSNELIKAYKEVAEKFSLDINKKILSERCSLSKILNN